MSNRSGSIPEDIAFYKAQVGRAIERPNGICRPGRDGDPQTAATAHARAAPRGVCLSSGKQRSRMRSSSDLGPLCWGRLLLNHLTGKSEEGGKDRQA
jgi:hypothetical protein